VSNRHGTIVRLVLIASMTLATLSEAQSFTVASVKAVDPAARQTISMRRFPGGRVTATSVTLKFLIGLAYGVQDIQISGGPDWVNRAEFNVNAEGEDDAGSLPAMFQSLLEERFNLAVRRETREVSVYALRLAKPGGKFGPNLHEADAGDCPQEPPPTPAQIKSPLWTPCGAFHASRGHLSGKKVTLRMLTSPLVAQVGRPVLDETGVTDKLDLALDWTADANLGPQGDRGQAQGSTEGPSIFTALREQLGLKLESGKGPVEILVVEHAEKPSED
jgi:uncharacterized protein (TIGR03435 family)